MELAVPSVWGSQTEPSFPDHEIQDHALFAMSWLQMEKMEQMMSNTSELHSSYHANYTHYGLN